MNNLETELTFTRFERMCEKYPDRPAVIYLGEKFTYSRLKDLRVNSAKNLKYIEMMRFFTEFTLSHEIRLFASLRVTVTEGLRMTC